LPINWSKFRDGQTILPKVARLQLHFLLFKKRFCLAARGAIRFLQEFYFSPLPMIRSYSSEIKSFSLPKNNCSYFLFLVDESKKGGIPRGVYHRPRRARNDGFLFIPHAHT